MARSGLVRLVLCHGRPAVRAGIAGIRIRAPVPLSGSYRGSSGLDGKKGQPRLTVVSAEAGFSAQMGPAGLACPTGQRMGHSAAGRRASRRRSSGPGLRARAPDEWYVCVAVRGLAVLRDGRRAPRRTASRNLYYPCCFRDGSEIRPRTTASSAASSMRTKGPGR